MTRLASRLPGLGRLSTVGILIVILAAGCAEERPAIDRVQPNAILKSQFAGEWYYQRTVVDVPAANGFTFVGNTDHSGMSRVTWDIQEDFLYARRTTELIAGSDGKATAGSTYEGEVIAAFKIEKHFDIVNAYNPTTGEQLNILEENDKDRPWYEREYIRVDWKENLVTNYQLDFEAASVESVPYYVQEKNPETGERNPDAPLFEPDGTYFDVTTRLFAKAGTVELAGYGEIPVCWLRGEEFTECGAGEYSIRHSFLKIDPNHQYKALPYKGKATETFGYFVSDRLQYNGLEGIHEQAKHRHMNRHNLWETWFDESGKELAPAKRTLRPIVYYVNTDFPDDLKPIAQDVATQWNSVFTDTVKAMGHEPKEDVFVLCPNNPVLEGDPARCGAAGLSPRLGDVRYSFMAYVPKYMTYGLLGLGPSNNDPETGEIISGMGYVYHHNNLAAFRVQEMLELLNGTLPADEFIEGENLSDWMSTVNADESVKQSPKQFGLKDAEHMVKRIANGWQSKMWADIRTLPSAADEQAQAKLGFDAWVAPYVQRMYEHGVANGEKHSPDGKLANLKGTYIEDLLLNDEILMTAGVEPGMPATEEQKKAASVARGGFGKHHSLQAELRERFAASRNMYLPEMADDALIGLAKELKGMDPAEAYAIVRRSIYTAVLAHEVGHSLGLMHNFGGSDDAINYHDEYWKIRDDGNVGPRLDDPVTSAETDAKIYNYAYSSVMDYAGRYTIDGLGIGKYDRAAILFGYAEKVEVFKDNGSVPHQELRDWHERDGDILNFTAAGPAAVHYTSFYERMGKNLYSADNRMLVDVSTLNPGLDQATVDGTEYSRVPYIYCSHTRANLGDSCLTRDFGADPHERMKNILDDLDTWYITRNFPRGKVGVDNYSYVGRWYGRIYNRLKRWHDLYGLYHGLFSQFFSPELMESFLTNTKTGWGAQTWAVQNSFNYLVQTLLMPDVGNYGGPFNYGDDKPYMLSNVGGATFEIGLTQGRYFSTSWQSTERQCGYFFWECLHHVGFYLDKIMAIEALSDSSTNFVARSSPKDLREWEVSYYSTFAEQIGRINEAIIAQDWTRIGPYRDGDQVRWPNYTGALTEAHNAPIDPSATFTVQLYWQVLGQARFMNNFDMSFKDQSRIFVVGTGAAPELDPAKLTTFTDPLTGMVYGSLKYSGWNGAGESALERANKLGSRSHFCDAKGITESQADDCDPSVDDGIKDIITPRFLDYIELIKVMADVGPTLDYGNPYSL